MNEPNISHRQNQLPPLHTPEPYHNNSPGGPTADQIKKNIRKCNKVLLLDKALTCSKTLSVTITYDTPHMHIYKNN